MRFLASLLRAISRSFGRAALHIESRLPTVPCDPQPPESFTALFPPLPDGAVVTAWGPQDGGALPFIELATHTSRTQAEQATPEASSTEGMRAELQWTFRITGNVDEFLTALTASLEALARLRALPNPDAAAVQSHCDEITQLLGAAYAALDFEVK